MNRAEHAIAAAREWADEAILDDLDAQEARQERIETEAAAIAAEIVADPNRLKHLVATGSVVLCEIIVAFRGEYMDMDRALAVLIAESLSGKPADLQPFAQEIAAVLAERDDVIELAARRIRERDELDAEDAYYAP